MTAADRREELEALLWSRITPRQPGEAGRQEVGKLVEDILAAADRYTEAAANEIVPARVVGRLRLAEAAAEAGRRSGR